MFESNTIEKIKPEGSVEIDPNQGLKEGIINEGLQGLPYNENILKSKSAVDKGTQESVLPGQPENYEKIEGIEGLPSFLREIGKLIWQLYQKREELKVSGQDTKEMDEFLHRFEDNGDIQLFLEGIRKFLKDLLDSTSVINQSNKEIERKSA